MRPVRGGSPGASHCRNRTLCYISVMENARSSTGTALAAVIWIGACTQSGSPRPDSQATSPQLDARPGWHPFSNANCVDPSELDSGPPATFDVTGCLWHTLDNGRALAVFIWTNRAGEVQIAPYGLTNHVSPGVDAQGQPALFGFARGQFAVPLDGSQVTWAILGQSVTVSQASPDCGSACSYYDQPGCIDCPGHWVDTCTVACGDGVCGDGETCDSCPADCDCSSLVPLVDCVIPLGGGRKLVSFGYNNKASTDARLEIGPEDQFLSGQPARGQPVLFQAGEHHSVFQVTYDGPDVTWMLAGSPVTVPSDAPLCSQNCGSSCPSGTTCVADECQGSCGDGQCFEDCDSCPDDCGCPAGAVCCGGGCHTLPSCGGIGLECGTDDTCGFHVDCGLCPDGQACLHNSCEPICPVDPGT